MSDKAKLKELAALAGSWENLALHLWEHMDTRSKSRTIKRFIRIARVENTNPFEWSEKKKCGRPSKYHWLGTSVILMVLGEMKRLGIGGEKHTDRIESVICYVHDPKAYRIWGMPSSLRDLLTEPEVVDALPKLETGMFGKGQKKVADIVQNYLKYLSTYARKHKYIFEAAEAKSSRNSPLQLPSDYEHSDG